MRAFVKMLAFFLHFLLVFLMVTACYAGLYMLANSSRPEFRNEPSVLKDAAGYWGMKLTAWTFVGLIALIILSIAFHDPTIRILTESPEWVLYPLYTYVLTMALGLLASIYFFIAE